MGKMQRIKGKRFERVIAAQLRVLWPDAEIRRSSQAERAYEADVFATGSRTLERLWLELQDARNPTPLKKLAQAERDIAAGGVQTSHRMPVVVWHRIRETTVQVTTRLWVLDRLRGFSIAGSTVATDGSAVQLELGAFLDLVVGSRKVRQVGTQRHQGPTEAVP